MRPSDFKVGQKLVAVYSLNRQEPMVRDVCVVGVGRKWVGFEEIDARYPSRDRFDPFSMQIDGGQRTSPGRVYLDRDDYARERRAAKLRHAIRDAINRGDALRRLSLENLELVATIMGVASDDA